MLKTKRDNWNQKRSLATSVVTINYLKKAFEIFKQFKVY